MKDNFPTEGIDYEIEDPVLENGPQCPSCHNVMHQDHKGRFFCPRCIAALYDSYQKQDTTLNMRINTKLLEDLKEIARFQGETNYQRFIRELLIEAVRKRKAS